MLYPLSYEGKDLRSAVCATKCLADSTTVTNSEAPSNFVGAIDVPRPTQAMRRLFAYGTGRS